MICCKRCGAQIQTFSPMRKWCVECRRLLAIERIKQRKVVSVAA